MFGRPSEHRAPPPPLSAKNRGSREGGSGMGWEKILDSYGLRFGCGRGRRGRGGRAHSPRMEEGRKEGRKDVWVGPGSLFPRFHARSFALAGNLSAGKNVPKALERTNEHVEPPLTLVAVSQNGEGRFYSLEDLSRMTDDGKLPACLKRKKPLQDYGI